MTSSFKCDGCGKKTTVSGGLLFGPPGKNHQVEKYRLCRSCFKKVVQLLKFGISEIEDVLSLGPTWLNYTKRVKRKFGGKNPPKG